MTVDEQIIEALRERNEPLSPKEIARAKDLNHGYVRKRVRVLTRKEELRHLSGGNYVLRETSKTVEIEFLEPGRYPTDVGPEERPKKASPFYGASVDVDERLFAVESDPGTAPSEHPWETQMMERPPRPGAGGRENETNQIPKNTTNGTADQEIEKGWVGSKVTSSANSIRRESWIWALAWRNCSVGAEGHYLLYQWGNKEPGEDQPTGEYRTAYLCPCTGGTKVVEETSGKRGNRVWTRTSMGKYSLSHVGEAHQIVALIGPVIRVVMNPDPGNRR